MIRLRRMGYESMIAACAAVARKFGAPTWYDATGVGVGLAHTVSAEFGRPGAEDKSVHAIPVVFSNESKSDIVQHLQLSIQRKDFTMPYIREAVQEGDSFESKPLESGRWKYGAPAGEHD